MPQVVHSLLALVKELRLVFQSQPNDQGMEKCGSRRVN